MKLHFFQGLLALPIKNFSACTLTILSAWDALLLELTEKILPTFAPKVEPATSFSSFFTSIHSFLYLDIYSCGFSQTRGTADRP